MVDLTEMFKELYDGVHKGSERYAVIDSEHLMDTELGIEYHLYPHWKNEPFKITKDDVMILHGMQMTEKEAKILNSISAMLKDHFTEKDRGEIHKMWHELKIPVVEKPNLNII